MSFAAVNVIIGNFTFRAFKALVAQYFGLCAVIIFYIYFIAKLKSAVFCPGRVAVIIVIIKVVPALAELNTESIFTVKQIFCNIIPHCISTVAHFVLTLSVVLAQVTVTILRKSRHKQIITYSLAVYVKLKKAKSADCDFCIFHIICGKLFSEKRRRYILIGTYPLGVTE